MCVCVRVCVCLYSIQVSSNTPPPCASLDTALNDCRSNRTVCGDGDEAYCVVNATDSYCSCKPGFQSSGRNRCQGTQSVSRPPAGYPGLSPGPLQGPRVCLRSPCRDPGSPDHADIFVIFYCSIIHLFWRPSTAPGSNTCLLHHLFYLYQLYS